MQKPEEYQIRGQLALPDIQPVKELGKAMAIGADNKIGFIGVDLVAKEYSNEIVFLSPEPAQIPSEGMGEYIPGGRNVMADQYIHS